MSEVCWVGPDRKLVCIPLASWALDVEIKQITPSLERPPVHGENALDKLQVTRCQEKPGGNTVRLAGSWWRGCWLTWQQGETGLQVKGSHVPAHCEPTSGSLVGPSFNLGLSLFEYGEVNRSGEDDH